MTSLEVVTPAKAGVQVSHNSMKTLDSGFRRNDGKEHFSTFYEIVNAWVFCYFSRCREQDKCEVLGEVALFRLLRVSPLRE